MPKISEMVDETTVRLLTVLNAVNSKRPLDDWDVPASERPAKLNRKKVAIADSIPDSSQTTPDARQSLDEVNKTFIVESGEADENERKRIHSHPSLRNILNMEQLLPILSFYTLEQTPSILPPPPRRA